MKFEKINPEARRSIAKQATDGNKFREERRGWETAVPAPKPGYPVKLVKEPKPSTAVPGGPKDPVIPPKEGRLPKVTPPKESKLAQTQDEPKTRATPSAERESTFVAPRQVHVTRPERVKIPAPPISSKAAVETRPPSRPANEERQKADPAPKGSRKDDRERKGKAGGKDSRKDDDDSKGKR